MTDDRLDLRLPSIKVVDVILAALQASFGQEKLFGDIANPYRFVRDDPAQSRVWVCDPDARTEERDGKRMIVQVMRGEYSPTNMGLLGRAQGGFSNPIEQMDLASAPIYIICEAGSKIQSEVLGSICYSTIKYFRRELMAEYDIHALHVLGISPPQKQREANSTPWLTTVSLKVEMHEACSVVELANHLNKTLIRGEFEKNSKSARDILSLDSPPPMN